MKITGLDTRSSTERLVRFVTGHLNVAVRLTDVESIVRSDHVEDGHVPDPASQSGARLTVESVGGARHLPTGVVVITNATGARRAFGVDRIVGLVTVPSSDILGLPSLARGRCLFGALVASETFAGLLLGSSAWHRDRRRAAATSTAVRPGQMVTFAPTRTVATRVGLAAAQVSEVCDATGVVPVPGLPHRIAGVVAWRGQAVPVLDVCAAVGPLRGESAGERLLVTRVGGVDPELVALLAGRDIQFEDHLDQWLPAPVLDADRSTIQSAFARGADRVIFLNLPELLRLHESGPTRSS